MEFEEIKGWFDSDKWDMGYLTMEQLRISSYYPVKAMGHVHCWNCTNALNFKYSNIFS